MTNKSYTKNIILISAFIMQCFLGANYAWSIFAQELKAHYGFTMTECQSVFAVLQLTFAFIFIIGGKLHDKYGPKVLGAISGIIFGSGYFLAGFFKITHLSLLIFVGVMGGIGVALGYVCPVATAQKWFPGKRAFVTGIAVAGFGLGPFFIALAAEFFLKAGFSLPEIFRIFGITFFVIITASSLFFKLPESCKNSKAVTINVREIIFSKFFLSLFVPMFAGLFAGLMVISNLKTIGINWMVPELQAALGVSVIAIFNGAGRFVWGIITQNIGEERTIIISLLLQAIILISSVFVVKNIVFYFVFAAMVGFNYGASLVVYASKISKTFGAEKLGSIYPLLFISNGFAGFLAPVFAGFVFDKSGSYTPALLTAGLFCLAGYYCFVKLTPNPSHSEKSP